MLKIIKSMFLRKKTREDCMVDLVIGKNKKAKENLTFRLSDSVDCAILQFRQGLKNNNGKTS